MAYRRTERMIRRQAERHDAIVAAAGRAASEGGMAAVQIAPVAERAGIAAGTVYRYFPTKTELVGALVASAAEREIAAVRRAAEAAPGPLSALAAAIATFAARALRNRRLAWAVIAEPVDADIDAVRLAYRQALAERVRRPASTPRWQAGICPSRTRPGGAGAGRRAARRADRAARARTPATTRRRRARRCRR